jgi:uncharacterized cupredoxin-like copper-binding protein
MMKRVLSTFLSLALVLFVACRKSESTSDASTASDAAALSDTAAVATATHPASPGGTALVPDVSSGTTVVVVLSENTIAAKGQDIPPGPAVLTIENAGKEVHNLFVEGPGVSLAAGDTIAEGASRTMDVVFQAGTYTLYCPVLNHRENGEQTTITVGAAAGAAGTAGTTTGTTTAPATNTAGTT